MKSVSQERLDDITDEVFSLCGDDNIFDILLGQGDVSALENRLQEIRLQICNLESIELAMYLRASNAFRHRLPIWHSLLTSAINQGRLRGDPVEDIFFGLNASSYVL